MNNVLPFRSTAAISQFRFVRPNTKTQSAFTCTQAAAVTETIIGVSKNAATAAGGAMDIATAAEVVYLELGATVTVGARLTCDSVGRGVTAAPAAGTNNSIGAIALESGVVGDLVQVLVTPQTFQG